MMMMHTILCSLVIFSLIATGSSTSLQPNLPLSQPSTGASADKSSATAGVATDPSSATAGVATDPSSATAGVTTDPSSASTAPQCRSPATPLHSGSADPATTTTTTAGATTDTSSPADLIAALLAASKAYPCLSPTLPLHSASADGATSTTTAGTTSFSYSAAALLSALLAALWLYLTLKNKGPYSASPSSSASAFRHRHGCAKSRPHPYRGESSSSSTVTAKQIAATVRQRVASETAFSIIDFLETDASGAQNHVAALAKHEVPTYDLLRDRLCSEHQRIYMAYRFWPGFELRCFRMVNSSDFQEMPDEIRVPMPPAVYAGFLREVAMIVASRI